MNHRKLIVLTLDGLTPGSLGCYGSSWNSTPNIDSLASNGCVWDRWICRHTDPIENVRSWLNGSACEAGQDDWIQSWNSGKLAGGVELLSDDQEVIQLASKCDFEQLHFVDPSDEVATMDQQPAEDLESTQFAQLIAAAIERLNEPEPWSALWLHSNALRTRWDAPRWLADSDQLDRIESWEPLSESEQLELEMEQDDQEDDEHLPMIFDQVVVPNLRLEADAHPDLIATWMTTYACQVRLVDDLLGVLIDAASGTSGGEQPIVMVTGTSGMTLGQNGWIGHNVGPMRSCQIHVPMILSDVGPLRVGSLSSADCLSGLLARLGVQNEDCFSIDAGEWSREDGEFTPCLTSQASDGSDAATSSKWFLVNEMCEDNGAGSQLETRLFLKPDDVDDVNDVSRLRPDVIDQLEANSARDSKQE